MTSLTEEDGTGVVWTDKVWLSYFPLNAASALEYFSLSQFYDRSCNNELVKMQRLDPALMSTMAGIEYSLASHQSEHLFIINKSRRTTAPKPSLELLAVYYIVNGNIYQAPSAHAVLSSRVLQALHHLRSSFDVMQKHSVPTPNAANEVHWDPPPTPAAVPAAAKPRDRQSDAGTLERRAVDRILYDILDKNRRIAAVAATNAATRNETETKPGPEP